MIKISKLKIITVLVSCLCLILLTTGCTTTDAYTVSNNKIALLAPDYKIVAVWCDLADNKLASAFEHSVIDSLEKYGIEGYSWLDLFPPLKEYETFELLDKIDKLGVDMVVYINLQDSDISKSVYSSEGEIYTSTTGYAMYEFKFDPRDLDNPLLVTQITANGDEFSDWKMINAAAARRAVKEYAEAAGLERITTSTD